MSAALLLLRKRGLANADTSLSTKVERLERWAQPTVNKRHGRSLDCSNEPPIQRSHRDSPHGADSIGSEFGQHSYLSSASSDETDETQTLYHGRGCRRSDASLSRLLAWEGRQSKSTRHGRYGQVAAAPPMRWTRVATVDEYEWGSQSMPPTAQLRIRKEHGVAENRACAEVHLMCGGERCLIASVERLAGPADAFQQSFVLTSDGEALPEVVHRRTAFVGGGALDLEVLSSSGQVDAAREVMQRAASRAGVASASALVEALLNVDEQDPLVRTALGTLNELVC